MLSIREIINVAHDIGRDHNGVDVELKHNGNRLVLATTAKKYSTRIHYADTDRNTIQRVWCDCADFRFTFWPALKTANATRHFLSPIKLSGTGVVRHIEECGCCKHIIATHYAAKH